MTLSNARASLSAVLAATLLAAAPCVAQGGAGCPSSSGPPPLQPSAPFPAAGVVEAWVDPVAGDDTAAALAAPGLVPFRTIQAACDALAPLVGVGGGFGAIVNLLPGRYGWSSAGTHNGEVWPVLLPPGVSLRGVSALTVVLDGAAIDPAAAPATLVPDPASGAPVARTPVIVLGGTQLWGYDYTQLAHVAIVGADIGVFVTGEGEVRATIASSLFTQCDVGVQVHSEGTAVQGVHRPRLLHCTFAANALGFAVTAGGGSPMLPRARPALVNCLFKNVVDLEGVSCDGVVACAFAPARVDLSAAIVPPATLPAAVFDADAFSFRDLFLGPRSLPAGVDPTPEADLVTDYRLTFRTEMAPVLPNPARGTGNAIYPVVAANGTVVDVVFPGGLVGWRDGEGAGNAGPTNPSNPHGTSIGYDVSGMMHVGGAAPVVGGFGVSAGGVLFDRIDVWFDPGTTPLVLLAGVAGAPLWTPGSLAPMGLLDVDDATLVPGILGLSSLDFMMGPTDMSYLLGLVGGSSNRLSIQLGVVNLASPIQITLQSMGLTAGGQAIFSEPQTALILPTPEG